MERLKEMIAALGRLDRRYVYLVLLVSVGVPLIVPVSFRAEPSAETRRFVAELDVSIEDPRPILVGVDYRPQTMAEMEPILLAIMGHVFHAGKMVVFLNFTEETSPLLRENLAQMSQKYRLENGKDYVYLGYAASYAQTIQAMGRSIRDTLHADDRGVPLEDIPLFGKVQKLGDFSTVISVASIAMADHWISFGVTPYKFHFLAACTATKAVDYYPYLQTGQIKGLIAGGRAAAEYEGILEERGVLETPGDASRALGSQSLALFTILAFVVFGNVGYLSGRLRNRRRRTRR